MDITGGPLLTFRRGVGYPCRDVDWRHIIVGLAIAAAVTRTLATFLVLVGSLDILTFVAVTGLLGAVALAACYLPARRAMRVDPMVALRHE